MIGIEESLAVEVTKQAIRKKVWHYLEKNKFAYFPRPVHGRIPNFKGAPEAGQRLSKLDVFKNASTIIVTPDKPQEEVRFLALEAKKNLLVPIPGLRSGLFQHVKPPPGASKQELKVVSSQECLDLWITPVGLNDKVKLDLFVLGSVAVSKEGYRIGKGEGYADLEFAMMMKMEAVNQNTTVVTTVHDCQVFKTLPAQLFKAHDVPVDFIITPTQVIEVDPRLPKPNGIIWSFLSRQRLNDIPILQTLREAELGEGNDCTLKEVDADIKERQRSNWHGGRRNHFRKHDVCNPAASEDAVAGSQLSVLDGEDIQSKGPTRLFQLRNVARKKTTSTSEDISGEEVNKNESVPGKDTEKERRRFRPQQRPAIEFNLRVGNIAPYVRVSDLKAALAERDIKPTNITWRGHRGFAILHFAKAGGSGHSMPSSPVSVDSIVASLQDLKLGAERRGDFLKVEPVKPVTKIEVTDISSV